MKAVIFNLKISWRGVKSEGPDTFSEKKGLLRGR